MITSKRVLMYAMASVLFVFFLSITWEFFVEQGNVLDPNLVHGLESNGARWMHVFILTSLASVAVGVMFLVNKRTMRELEEKEKSLANLGMGRRFFLTDAAHELRTPLAVLRAHLDTLKTTDTTSKLRDDVDHISRVVEQLLVKSRISAIDVQPGDKIDLSKVVVDTVSYMGPLIIKAGRSVEVIGGEHPVMMNGNRFALDHALRNLLENAISYAARGTTITIEILNTYDKSELRIIDHGVGVPENDREFIFERFQRSDRRGTGCGLGLSIVRRVAESHGGHVFVMETEGGGATFVLSFKK